MANLLKVLRVRETLQALKKRRDFNERAFANGLKQAGSFVLNESQRIVPVDTGDLRRSGFTSHEGTGAKTIVKIGYRQSYAIYVHENLEARHAPGKSAKYLTKPMRKYKQQIIQIIRNAVLHGAPSTSRVNPLVALRTAKGRIVVRQGARFVKQTTSEARRAISKLEKQESRTTKRKKK